MLAQNEQFFNKICTFSAVFYTNGLIEGMSARRRIEQTGE
jgi:hypothetical protein